MTSSSESKVAVPFNQCKLRPELPAYVHFHVIELEICVVQVACMNPIN